MVIVLRKGERGGEREIVEVKKKKKIRSKYIKPSDKRMLLSRTIRVEEMLELGRVDFEVTLTLCRWERASCAPCYVLARFNSDGGSSFPRPHSPPLSQHQRFQDNSSLSKTHLSTVLSPLDCVLGYKVCTSVEGSNFCSVRISFSKSQFGEAF